MSPNDKPLVWLHSEALGLPHSRPMPSIGRKVHELRIPDEDSTWRVVYRVDGDAIVISEVFSKKTPQTPQRVILTCKARYAAYDEIVGNKR